MVTNTRINNANISALLDTSQKQFGSLFDALLLIKNYKNNSLMLEVVTTFQFRLARVLFGLATARREISFLERRTVSRKKSFSKTWFLKRMRTLSKYKKSIDTCLTIGKALGDSFIWTFYLLEQDKLIQEYQTEGNLIPPDGIGGIGELKFVERFPVFEGCLTLLHSNTTILKTGDVSFIDLKEMQLTAIGEIKTLKVGDAKIDIQLTIVEHGEKSSFAKKVKIQTDTAFPAYFAPERYRRQVKRMGEHLKGGKAKDYTDSSDILYRDFHIAELEKCVSQCSSRQRLSIVKAGEGVLYVAVSLHGRNFSSRMNASEKSVRDLFEKNAHLISEHYLSIHSMDTPNYPVQYGHVLYQRDLTYYLQIGCWPLFWYPIKASVLRKLYLQEVIVFTLLNPTFIIEALKTYDIVCRKSTHVNKLGTVDTCLIFG